MTKRLYMLGIFLLCQAANLIAAVWMLLAILGGSKRAWIIAKSYDQLGNAATGGSEDELISSRAGKAKQHGRKWACILCKFLDKIEKDHCKNSIEIDEGRK